MTQEEQFIQAARDGDIIKIRKLLDEHIDINTRAPCISTHHELIVHPGATALHWAVTYGQIEIIKFLLTHGAQVNAQDNKGWTALHYVFWTSYRYPLTALETYKRLKAQGANGTQPNHEGKLPHQVGQYHSLHLPTTVALHGLFPQLNHDRFFYVPESAIHSQFVPPDIAPPESWLSELCYYFNAYYRQHNAEAPITFLLDGFGGCKLFLESSQPEGDLSAYRSHYIFVEKENKVLFVDIEGKGIEHVPIQDMWSFANRLNELKPASLRESYLALSYTNVEHLIYALSSHKRPHRVVNKPQMLVDIKHIYILLFDYHPAKRLSVDAKKQLLEQLRSGMSECSKGFETRVKMTLQGLSVINVFEDLVYGVRQNIVQNVVQRREEIHESANVLNMAAVAFGVSVGSPRDNDHRKVYDDAKDLIEAMLPITRLYGFVHALAQKLREQLISLGYRGELKPTEVTIHIAESDVSFYKGTYPGPYLYFPSTQNLFVADNRGEYIGASFNSIDPTDPKSRAKREILAHLLSAYAEKNEHGLVTGQMCRIPAPIWYQTMGYELCNGYESYHGEEHAKFISLIKNLLPRQNEEDYHVYTIGVCDSDTYLFLELNWQTIYRYLLEKICEEGYFTTPLQQLTEKDGLTLLYHSHEDVVDFFHLFPLSLDQYRYFLNAVLKAKPAQASNLLSELLVLAAKQGNEAYCRLLLDYQPSMNYWVSLSPPLTSEVTQALGNAFKSISFITETDSQRVANKIQENPTPRAQKKESIYKPISVQKEWTETINPLMGAIASGSLPLFKLFLAKGALINHSNCKGWSVIHHLAYYSSLYPKQSQEMLNLLIAQGVDLESKTLTNHRPVHVAQGRLHYSTNQANSHMTFRLRLLHEEFTLAIMRRDVATFNELVAYLPTLPKEYAHPLPAKSETPHPRKSPETELAKTLQAELKEIDLQISQLKEHEHAMHEMSLLADDLIFCGYSPLSKLTEIEAFIVALLQVVHKKHPIYDFTESTHEPIPTHWLAWVKAIQRQIPENASFLEAVEHVFRAVQADYGLDSQPLAILLDRDGQKIPLGGDTSTSSFTTIEKYLDLYLVHTSITQVYSPKVHAQELLKALLLQGNLLESFCLQLFECKTEQTLGTTPSSELMQIQAEFNLAFEQLNSFQAFYKLVRSLPFNPTGALLKKVAQRLSRFETDRLFTIKGIKSQITQLTDKIQAACNRIIYKELQRRKQHCRLQNEESLLAKLQKQILSTQALLEQQEQEMAVQGREVQIKWDELTQLEKKQSEVAHSLQKQLATIAQQVQQLEQQRVQTWTEVTQKTEQVAQLASTLKVSEESQEIQQETQKNLEAKHKALLDKLDAANKRMTTLRNQKEQLEAKKTNLDNANQNAQIALAEVNQKLDAIREPLLFIEKLQKYLKENPWVYRESHLACAQKLETFLAEKASFSEVYRYFTDTSGDTLKLVQCKQPTLETHFNKVEINFYTADLISAVKKIFVAPPAHVDVNNQTLVKQGFNIRWSQVHKETIAYVREKLKKMAIEIDSNHKLMTSSENILLQHLPKKLLDFLSCHIKTRYPVKPYAEVNRSPEWSELQQWLSPQLLSTLDLSLLDVLHCFVETIEVTAGNHIWVDEDIHLPGINVFLHSNGTLELKSMCQINTSGIPAPSYQQPRARNGEDYRHHNIAAGHAGEHGLSGFAGMSAGHIYLFAELTVYGMQELTCLATGGHGSNGQAGGHGDQGKMGKGTGPADPDEICGDHENGFFGSGSSGLVAAVARIPGKGVDEEIIEAERSGPGGLPGEAGLGGEGGLPGNITLINGSHAPPVLYTGEEGVPGHHGPCDAHGGAPGLPGKQGDDVARLVTLTEQTGWKKWLSPIYSQWKTETIKGRIDMVTLKQRLNGRFEQSKWRKRYSEQITSRWVVKPFPMLETPPKHETSALLGEDHRETVSQLRQQPEHAFNRALKKTNASAEITYRNELKSKAQQSAVLVITTQLMEKTQQATQALQLQQQQYENKIHFTQAQLSEQKQLLEQNQAEVASQNLICSLLEQDLQASHAAMAASLEQKKNLSEQYLTLLTEKDQADAALASAKVRHECLHIDIQTQHKLSERLQRIATHLTTRLNEEMQKNKLITETLQGQKETVQRNLSDTKHALERLKNQLEHIQNEDILRQRTLADVNACLQQLAGLKSKTLAQTVNEEVLIAEDSKNAAESKLPLSKLVPITAGANKIPVTQEALEPLENMPLAQLIPFLRLFAEQQDQQTDLARYHQIFYKIRTLLVEAILRECSSTHLSSVRVREIKNQLQHLFFQRLPRLITPADFCQYLILGLSELFKDSHDLDAACAIMRKWPTPFILSATSESDYTLITELGSLLHLPNIQNKHIMLFQIHMELSDRLDRRKYLWERRKIQADAEQSMYSEELLHAEKILNTDFSAWHTILAAHSSPHHQMTGIASKLLEEEQHCLLLKTHDQLLSPQDKTQGQVLIEALQHPCLMFDEVEFKRELAVPFLNQVFDHAGHHLNQHHFITITRSLNELSCDPHIKAVIYDSLFARIDFFALDTAVNHMQQGLALFNQFSEFSGCSPTHLQTKLLASCHLSWSRDIAHLKKQNLSLLPWKKRVQKIETICALIQEASPLLPVDTGLMLIKQVHRCLQIKWESVVQPDLDQTIHMLYTSCLEEVKKQLYPQLIATDDSMRYVHYLNHGQDKASDNEALHKHYQLLILLLLHDSVDIEQLHEIEKEWVRLRSTLILTDPHSAYPVKYLLQLYQVFIQQILMNLGLVTQSLRDQVQQQQAKSNRNKRYFEIFSSFYQGTKDEREQAKRKQWTQCLLELATRYDVDCESIKDMEGLISAINSHSLTLLREQTLFSNTDKPKLEECSSLFHHCLQTATPDLNHIMQAWLKLLDSHLEYASAHPQEPLMSIFMKESELFLKRVVNHDREIQDHLQLAARSCEGFAYKMYHEQAKQDRESDAAERFVQLESFSHLLDSLAYRSHFYQTIGTVIAHFVSLDPTHQLATLVSYLDRELPEQLLKFFTLFEQYPTSEAPVMTLTKRILETIKKSARQSPQACQTSLIETMQLTEETLRSFQDKDPLILLTKTLTELEQTSDKKPVINRWLMQCIQLKPTPLACLKLGKLINEKWAGTSDKQTRTSLLQAMSHEFITQIVESVSLDDYSSPYSVLLQINGECAFNLISAGLQKPSARLPLTTLEQHLQAQHLLTTPTLTQQIQDLIQNVQDYKQSRLLMYLDLVGLSDEALETYELLLAPLKKSNDLSQAENELKLALFSRILRIKLGSIEDSRLYNRLTRVCSRLFILLNGQAKCNPDLGQMLPQLLDFISIENLSVEHLISTWIGNDAARFWLLPFFLTNDEIWFSSYLSEKDLIEILTQKSPSTWSIYLRKHYWETRIINCLFKPLPSEFATLSGETAQIFQCFLQSEHFLAANSLFEEIKKTASEEMISACQTILECKKYLAITHTVAHANANEQAWLDLVETMIVLREKTPLDKINSLFQISQYSLNLSEFSSHLLQTPASDLLHVGLCVILKQQLQEEEQYHVLLASTALNQLCDPVFNTPAGNRILIFLVRHIAKGIRQKEAPLSPEFLQALFVLFIDIGCEVKERLASDLEQISIINWKSTLLRYQFMQRFSIDDPVLIDYCMRLKKILPGNLFTLLCEVIQPFIAKHTKEVKEALALLAKKQSEVTEQILDELKTRAVGDWVTYLTLSSGLSPDSHDPLSVKELINVMLKNEDQLNDAVLDLLQGKGGEEPILIQLLEKIEVQFKKTYAELDAPALLKRVKENFDVMHRGGPDKATFLARGNESELVHFLAAMERAFQLHPQRLTLYKTQVIAMIFYIKSFDSEKGRLANISTGEGKSYITQMLAIACALRGETVDVITSSKALAGPDAEKAAPLMSLFGITVSNICDQDSEKDQNLRKERYKNCRVLYGDVASFQRDILLTQHFGKHIRPNPSDRLIVDEVDNMFIDNCDKILYISHPINDLKYMRDTLIFIWSCVNAPDMQFKTPGSIPTIIARYALECKNGTIKSPGEKQAHLSAFIERRLPIWIENAFLAKGLAHQKSYSILQQGEHAGKITINDLPTGVEQFNSQWSNGLHQFLQLKHLGRLTDESLRAIFVSNLSYFRGYASTGRIFGMSGTLGGADELELLRDKAIYHVDTFKLPKRKRDLHHHQTQMVYGDQNTWLDQIFTEIVSTVRAQDNLTSEQINALKENLATTREAIETAQTQSHELKTQFEQKQSDLEKQALLLKDLEHQIMQNLDVHEKSHAVSTSNPVTQLYEQLEREKKSFHALEESQSKLKQAIKEQETGLHVLQTVLTELNAQLNNNASRATLVVCEDKARASQIKKYVEERWTLAFKHPPAIYYYDSYLTDFAFKTQLVKSGDIIISTNIASRGTDFRLTEKLIALGGLHTLGTYMPSNTRIEKQIDGRAARNGEPGSSSYIIYDARSTHASNLSFEQLREERDELEAINLRKKRQQQIPKLRLEDEIAHAYYQFENEIKAALKHRCLEGDLIELQIKSLRDHWAFWQDLQNQPQAIPVDQRKTLFWDAFQKFKASCLLLLEENDTLLVTSASELTRLGQYYLGKNDQKALDILARASQHHSYFSGFAHYYEGQAHLRLADKKAAHRALTLAIEDFQQYQATLSSSSEIIKTIAQRFAYRAKDQANPDAEDLFTQDNAETIQALQIHCDAARAAVGGDLSSDMFRGGHLLKKDAEQIFSRLIKQVTSHFKAHRLSRKANIRQDENGVEQLYYMDKLIPFPPQYQYCKTDMFALFKLKLNPQASPIERSVDLSSLGRLIFTQEKWLKCLETKLQPVKCVRLATTFSTKTASPKSLFGQYGEEVHQWMMDQSSVLDGQHLHDQFIQTWSAKEGTHCDEIWQYWLAEKLIEETTAYQFNQASQHCIETSLKEIQGISPLENHLLSALGIDPVAPTLAKLIEEAILNVMKKPIFSLNETLLPENEQDAVQQLWTYFVQSNFARNPGVIWSNFSNSPTQIDNDLGAIRGAILSHIEPIVEGMPHYALPVFTPIPHTQPTSSSTSTPNSAQVDSPEQQALRQRQVRINLLLSEIMEGVNTALGTIAITPHIKVSNTNILDYFREQNLPPVIHFFIQDGCDFVLNLIEDEEVNANDWDVILCSIIAIAQIAAGALIIACCPAAAYLGEMLINEGISDLTFAITAHLNGNFSWEAYREHKVHSLTLSLLTAGVASALTEANAVKKATDAASNMSATLISKQVTEELIRAAVQVTANICVNRSLSTLSQDLVSQEFAKFKQHFKEKVQAQATSQIAAIKRDMKLLHAKIGSHDARAFFEKAIQRLNVQQKIDMELRHQLLSAAEAVTSKISSIKNKQLASNELLQIAEWASKASIAFQVAGYIEALDNVVNTSVNLFTELQDEVRGRLNQVSTQTQVDKLTEQKIDEEVNTQLQVATQRVLTQIQNQVEQIITHTVTTGVNYAMASLVETAKDKLCESVGALFDSKLVQDGMIALQTHDTPQQSKEALKETEHAQAQDAIVALDLQSDSEIVTAQHAIQTAAQLSLHMNEQPLYVTSYGERLYLVESSFTGENSSSPHSTSAHSAHAEPRLTSYLPSADEAIYFAHKIYREETDGTTYQQRLQSLLTPESFEEFLRQRAEIFPTQYKENLFKAVLSTIDPFSPKMHFSPTLPIVGKVELYHATPTEIVYEMIMTKKKGETFSLATPDEELVSGLAKKVVNPLRLAAYCGIQVGSATVLRAPSMAPATTAVAAATCFAAGVAIQEASATTAEMLYSGLKEHMLSVNKRNQFLQYAGQCSGEMRPACLLTPEARRDAHLKAIREAHSAKTPKVYTVLQVGKNSFFTPPALDTNLGVGGSQSSGYNLLSKP